MSDLYLILHKVRGEPAFDIAQRIQVGAEDETQPGWIEEIWIIPTSGHRARPFRYWLLRDIADAWNNQTANLGKFRIFTSSTADHMKGYDEWGNLPEHYAVTRADPPARTVAKPTTSLSDLGLED